MKPFLHWMHDTKAVLPKQQGLMKDVISSPYQIVKIQINYRRVLKYCSGRTVGKNKCATYSQCRSSVLSHIWRILGKLLTDRLFSFLLTVCPELYHVQLNQITGENLEQHWKHNERNSKIRPKKHNFRKPVNPAHMVGAQAPLLMFFSGPKMTITLKRAQM